MYQIPQQQILGIHKAQALIPTIRLEHIGGKV